MFDNGIKKVEFILCNWYKVIQFSLLFYNFGNDYLVIFFNVFATENGSKIKFI